MNAPAPSSMGSRIVIRTDASETIGFGHLIRCRALATELRDRGFSVQFVRSGDPAEDAPEDSEVAWIDSSTRVADGVVDAGLTLAAASLHGPIDAVVVDSYRLDDRWESFFRGRGILVIALDDLADRTHDCDILIDSNPLPGTRYEGLLRSDAHCLFGMDYVLLGRHYRDAAFTVRNAAQNGQRVLVCFGGGKQPLAIDKALSAAMDPRLSRVRFDFVVGSGQGTDEMTALLKNAKIGQDESRVTVHGWVDDLPRMLADSDMSLGGGGSMTWERIRLGVPSVVIALAPNQEPTSSALESLGLIRFLGALDDCSPTNVADAVLSLLHNEAESKRVKQMGPELVDGRGAARCVDAIVEALAQRTNN